MEQHDAVHHLERREDVCSFRFAADRSRRPLESPHGVVAVDGDDERIALPPCAEEYVDVPRMEKVEDAVGEDDAAGLRRSPPCRSGPIVDLSGRITRRRRAGQKMPSACGLKRTSRTYSGSSMCS